MGWRHDMRRIRADRPLTGAETTARYRQTHPEKVKAAVLDWRRRHPKYRRWHHATHYARQTEFLNIIREETPCTDCGQIFPWYVMEFDHRDGKQGSRCVTQYRRYSRKRLLLEIAKCDLVCANCHAVRTHKRAVSLGNRRDA